MILRLTNEAMDQIVAGSAHFPELQSNEPHFDFVLTLSQEILENSSRT
jgi:hypothetical protein